MDLSKMNFKRLSYDNYETWQLRAKQVLTREGLWKYVCDDSVIPADAKEPSDEWKSKNELALQTIGYLVEDAQLRVIKDAETAKEAWSLLKAYYVKDSSVGKVSLIKKLAKHDLKEGGDMRQYITEMEEIFEKLDNVGCQMGEDIKAAFILANLPESYESTVSTIQGRMEKFTLHFVKTNLLEEYERRKSKSSTTEDEKAMVAHSNRKFSADTEAKRKCYACGSLDHLIRGCELMKKVRAKSSKGEVKKSKALMVRSTVEEEETDFGGHVCFAAVQEESVDGWYLDSGASVHMTGRRELMEQCKQVPDKAVVLADGQVLRSKMQGVMKLEARNERDCPIRVELSDVSYVQGL